MQFKPVHLIVYFSGNDLDSVEDRVDITYTRLNDIVDKSEKNKQFIIYNNYKTISETCNMLC